MMEPAAGLHHPRDDCFGRQHHGLDVDRHHPVPVLFAHLDHRTALRYAHVVVEYVHPPVAVNGGLGHLLAVVQLGHVALEDRRLAALRLDILQRFLRPRLHLVHQQHLRALAGHQDRRRLAVADALAAGPGPGNNRHFALKPGGTLCHGVNS